MTVLIIKCCKLEIVAFTYPSNGELLECHPRSTTIPRQNHGYGSATVFAINSLSPKDSCI